MWPAKPKPDPELLGLFEESARNVQRVSLLLVEIHRLENEADRLQRAAVADLFANGIDPMMLIRWKDIFDTLEAAVDARQLAAAEDVLREREGRAPGRDADQPVDVLAVVLGQQQSAARRDGHVVG